MSERLRLILRAAAATLVTALLLPAGAAWAESESGGSSPHVAAKIFDVMVLRPLGMSALIVGAVFFVPVALMTAPSGRDNLEAAQEIFVTIPANDVFRRPLGEF